MQRIAIVLGTRPEIIKMSPVIRACEQTFGKSLIKNSAADMDYFILHTGQHYSYNMDRVFFGQLELLLKTAGILA
jgi:UDP-N-acetylglucosamine 2-epimerase (non-hydrolysing)